MNLFKKNKSFTLIELLVVIGIIVILAALIIVNITQARMSGRDAKRVADVASIQLALEMYKDAKGQYPAVTNWAAADGSTGQSGWNSLSAALSPYLSPLPKDPLNKPGYRYYVYIYIYNDGVLPPSNYTGAIIKTKLETGEEKMADDSCTAYTTNAIDKVYYDVITGSIPNVAPALSAKTLCELTPNT